MADKIKLMEGLTERDAYRINAQETFQKFEKDKLIPKCSKCNSKLELIEIQNPQFVLKPFGTETYKCISCGHKVMKAFADKPVILFNDETNFIEQAKNIL